MQEIITVSASYSKDVFEDYVNQMESIGDQITVTGPKTRQVFPIPASVKHGQKRVNYAKRLAASLQQEEVIELTYFKYSGWLPVVNVLISRDGNSHDEAVDAVNMFVDDWSEDDPFVVAEEFESAFGLEHDYFEAVCC